MCSVPPSIARVLSSTFQCSFNPDITRPLSQPLLTKLPNDLDKLLGAFGRRQVPAVAKDDEAVTRNGVAQAKCFLDRNVRVCLAPDEHCRLTYESGIALNSICIPAARRANHGAMHISRRQQMMSRLHFVLVYRSPEAAIHLFGPAAQHPARTQK